MRILMRMVSSSRESCLAGSCACIAAALALIWIRLRSSRWDFSLPGYRKTVTFGSRSHELYLLPEERFAVRSRHFAPQTKFLSNRHSAYESEFHTMSHRIDSLGADSNAISQFP